MSTLDKHLSDRERVCFDAWLKTALDDEDHEQAAYWQDQGLQARHNRLCPDQPPLPPTPRPRCPECGDNHTDWSCVL
jgi:hypothetical protein